MVEQAARPASVRLSRAVYRVLASQARAVGDRPQTYSVGLLTEDRARSAPRAGWPGIPPACLVIDASVVIN